jgi:hypothetical protein
LSSSRSPRLRRSECRAHRSKRTVGEGERVESRN